MVAKRLSSFINVGVRSGLSIYETGYCIHCGSLKWLFIVVYFPWYKKENVRKVLCATLIFAWRKIISLASLEP